MLVTDDRESSEAMTARLAQLDAEPLVAEKRGLDGGVAEWIISAVVALGGDRASARFHPRVREG